MTSAAVSTAFRISHSARCRSPCGCWALTLRQAPRFDLVMEFLVGPPPLGPAPALPLRLSTVVET